MNWLSVWVAHLFSEPWIHILNVWKNWHIFFLLYLYSLTNFLNMLVFKTHEVIRIELSQLQCWHHDISKVHTRKRYIKVVIVQKNILFKLWGLCRCTAKLYHRNSLPNVRPDKLTHSPDCWCHLVHRGTSLQIQRYCCLMSKWTSLPHTCHSLRSSIDNSSTTQANTWLTK